MDLTKIKSLIALLHESGLSALELTEDGDTLRLERGGLHASSAVSRPATSPMAAPASATPEAPASMVINAPMHGILHLTPGPGEAPFVKVGDLIQPEQVICVIEAMKMFNKVEADHRGRIAEILVAPDSEVKAGQALFRLA